ncbi:MAG: DUF5989 family protein [Candidatus Lernaella stagnicola]|nr:DUF5989 family protein [Candidatus Lernaella stagnicola]
MADDLNKNNEPLGEEKYGLPEKPPGIVKEFFIFLRDYKLWWITPIVLVILLMSLFIFFTEGSAVLPFIYAVF